MTISFYTNFINHHQVPLADEFYKMIGSGYTMIVFEPLPEIFKKKGYADYSYKPYLLKAYENESNMQKSIELAIISDVVIHGAAPQYIIERRLQLNKLTFKYGERLFKKIDRRILKFSYWKQLYNEYTKYRNKNYYMLGASAYNRIDNDIIFAFPHKCYKWGYFINSPKINISSILELKRDSCIQILWCGTIAQVKRPDLAIKLAARLKRAKIKFHLTMIGDGGEEWKELINKLIITLNVSEYVTMLGNIPNNEVLEMMRKHHIFIFTSDRGEGWGVVLNEAMANGCTVVASDKIGSAPFLIKHKHNGMLFKSGNSNSLFKSTMYLLQHADDREKFAQNAYDTISNLWSPQNAAINFLKLVDSIQNKRQNINMEGPCSDAKYTNLFTQLL